jgi:hypothetical protein
MAEDERLRPRAMRWTRAVQGAWKKLPELMLQVEQEAA